eukprot:CAMPEP_0180494482 /NCGR_PEP_ID=MMETSP1036_2-20121128/41261_1 /TAXON_ID=632150 /ORGANISM="Azadinium spinosum, Strain 3D9" /LENGTH=49 /DNA_ID=CAMNT_0022502923 /DNA_START=74 /DNA_END=223 /DNA_ORIENTATION=+
MTLEALRAHRVRAAAAAEDFLRLLQLLVYRLCVLQPPLATSLLTNTEFP